MDKTSLQQHVIAGLPGKIVYSVEEIDGLLKKFNLNKEQIMEIFYINEGDVCDECNFPPDDCLCDLGEPIITHWTQFVVTDEFINSINIPEITEDIKTKYLENKGLVCPFCSCETFECNLGTNNGDLMEIKTRCLDCKAEWIDMYSLVGIKEKR
jgi:hypothetical protein